MAQFWEKLNAKDDIKQLFYWKSPIIFRLFMSGRSAAW